MYCNHKISNLQLLNNKRIGLLGGSFNPAHIGHVSMSQYALAHLDLDYIIWLVTPQNPLKPPYETSLIERATYASNLPMDDRIFVSTLEEEIKSFTTYDTLLYLNKALPGAELTWLMGADCLDQFHLWENFDKFTELANIAIFNRKNSSDYIDSTIAGKLLRNESLKNNRFRVIFCDNQLVDISSTEIRKAKNDYLIR